VVGGINAVLNIDKVPGLTSMDVVRKIKRLTSQHHVGHGGTLDPQASGVLPICLGYASKLMQFLVDSTKEYTAVVHLGIATDTYDAEGQVTTENNPSNVDQEAVETALVAQRGIFYQTPPMYSALKHEGRRLYDLARSGVEVERTPRKVEVSRLEVANWKFPSLTLEIECSRGVYIRSIAHDLGQALGCGAHLTALRRTRTGPFHVNSSVTLEQFQELHKDSAWGNLLYAPDYMTLHLPAVLVSQREETQLLNGQPVALTPRSHYAQHLQKCRAYTADGRFIALVQFNRPLLKWQPFKVFQSKVPSPYSARDVLV
jgi:tRNA pseudouridine55 synthase